MHRQIFNLRGQEIYSPDHALQLECLEEKYRELPRRHPLRDLGAEAIQVELLTSSDGDSSYLWLRPIKKPVNKNRVYLDGLNLMLGVSNVGCSRSKLLTGLFNNSQLLDKVIADYSEFYESMGQDYVDTQRILGIYLAALIRNFNINRL